MGGQGASGTRYQFRERSGLSPRLSLAFRGATRGTGATGRLAEGWVGGVCGRAVRVGGDGSCGRVCAIWMMQESAGLATLRLASCWVSVPYAPGDLPGPARLPPENVHALEAHQSRLSA
jgi:hypothetical protein